MSKKLKDLKWETVALEGFPASVPNNLHGFVGLEECTEYGLDKESKRPKKKKAQKKRKQSTEIVNKEIPNKKIKLSNGFVVESCNQTIPSLTNEDINKSSKKKKLRKKKENKNAKEETAQITKNMELPSNIKYKIKLGEDVGERNNDLTAEDMLSWAEFKLPEPIMKALMELGFKKPTKIQQLSLPAAIHGRRDILGAAETGSGKTLAFGLPILTGIIKLKEKVAKGFDPYDLPFKKTSNKKKSRQNAKNNKNENIDKIIKSVNRNDKKSIEKYVTKNKKFKESSEEGYSSGEDNSNDEKLEKNTKINDDTKAHKKKSNDDDFIEEIDVPIRKRKESSADEGNDSDDDENYIHLSELFDSDDLAENSDNDEAKSNEENSDTDSAEQSSENEESDENLDKDNNSGEVFSENEDETVSGEENSGDDEEEESVEEMSENEDTIKDQGIGCVKVIDNIEMPQPASVRTGKPLYALILTPTRELAIQISRHLMAVAKYTGIKIATIVGGMAAVKQERVLNKGPEIVVATPGRLWELLTQGHPHLQQLDSVKFLAIDETDRMIERSHFEELHPLLERLNADEERKATRQNFVFSATLTMVHDLPSHMLGKKVTKRGKIINRKVSKMTAAQKVSRLVGMIGMTEPKVVDITHHNSGTAESLTESRITCSFDQKDAYVYYILKRHPGRTIVFCNSIGCVQRLAQLLTILNCKPLPLHASMQQRQRLKNLERFRDDSRGVLVATDVAARGLDIPNVDHVIHYQVPKTAENYVHRSGRTARASKEGLTILMMEPREAYLYTKMCRTLNKTSEVPMFPVHTASLSPFKDIVSVARDIDALELRRRRATQAAGWREKAARDMDMIIDEDDIPVTKVDPSIEKALKAKKRELQRLLSRPLFPRGFSYKYPTLNDPSALTWSDENALQVMKKALQSGEIKKNRRKSKNASLLKLEKDLKKK